MALLARLTDHPRDSERRQDGRRKLQLAAMTTYAESANGVMILDLSSTGLMIETAIPLHVGDAIEVELPRTEPQDARVIWQRETYYGCEFASPVPQAVIGAALLRSPAPFAAERDLAPNRSSAAVSRQSLVQEPSGKLPSASPLMAVTSLGILGAAVLLLLVGLLII